MLTQALLGIAALLLLIVLFRMFGKGSALNSRITQVEEAEAKVAAMRGKKSAGNSQFKQLVDDAEAGDLTAQLTLGTMYLYGHSMVTGEDHASGEYWFRKAAEQESPEAWMELGRMYLQGTHVERDPVHALQWLRKAAAAGHAYAQWYMGRCLLNGEGVAVNPEEAVQWLRKSVTQGVPEAMVLLGSCLESGEGIRRDIDKALEFYRIAAEQGLPDAWLKLAVLYAYGRGVKADRAHAMLLLQQPALEGREEAERLKEDILTEMHADEEKRWKEAQCILNQDAEPKHKAATWLTRPHRQL